MVKQGNTIARENELRQKIRYLAQIYEHKRITLMRVEYQMRNLVIDDVITEKEYDVICDRLRYQEQKAKKAYTRVFYLLHHRYPIG